MKIESILSNYNHNNAGCKKNLATLLTHGKLSGTGKLIILPVDQGFEHGPEESFAKNPSAYDPEYHIRIATEAAPIVSTCEDEVEELIKISSAVYIGKVSTSVFYAGYIAAEDISSLSTLPFCCGARTFLFASKQCF